MSRFTQPLVVVPRSEVRRAQEQEVRRADARSWVLYTDDFVYEVGSIGSGEAVEVPQGFVTDFASVPRLLWFFIAPWGRHGPAAVLHDWGYWRQEPADRKYWDDLFLEAMKVLEVTTFHRTVLYWAVRWFAGRAWESNKSIFAVDKFEDAVAMIAAKKGL